MMHTNLWLNYVSRSNCFTIPSCFWSSLHYNVAICLLLCQGWRCYVVVRSVILSFVLFVSRITHDRSNGRRPNMVDMGKGDPLQVVNFWCWSGSGCGSTIDIRLFTMYFDSMGAPPCLFSQSSYLCNLPGKRLWLALRDFQVPMERQQDIACVWFYRMVPFPMTLNDP